MTYRNAVPLVLVTFLAGCTQSSESLEAGQRPPNIPGEMSDARSSKPVGTAEERAKKVADRLKEAEAASAKKDYDQAIEKLREAMLIEPKDRKVIGELARLYHLKSQANFKTDISTSYYTTASAAGYVRVLRDYYPEQTAEEKAVALEIHYDEATLEAMSSHVDETIKALNDAIGAGFKDFDRIRNDPEWAKMLAQPPFKKAFPDIVKK